MINFFDRTGTILAHDGHERLQRAAAVAQLAFKELPSTFLMGRVLPGKVSEACLNAWGTRCNTWDDFALQQAAFAPAPPAEEVFKEQLKAAAMEEIDPDALVAEAAVLEATQDNVDLPISSGDLRDQAPAADTPAPGWGVPDADTSGSGAAGTAGTGWGAAADAAATGWGTASASVSDWSIVYVSLLELLGPTALPLTHAPAVVEKSTRRIVAALPPSTAPRAPGLRGAGAVEDVLARRFGRVLLAPWGACAEDSDLMPPQVMPKSRGPVVVRGAAGRRTVEGAVPGVKPHDPHKDTITVLVDPEAVDQIVVNMGLGATWVQIVRQLDTDVEAEPKEPTTTFWYMEQMSQLMPSYYTDP